MAIGERMKAIVAAVQKWKPVRVFQHFAARRGPILAAGLSYQALFSDAFEPSSRHGVGAALAYAFHISPTFNLGLTLAYRLYPGSVATQQLGYGVLLEHFFSPDWSHADGVFPFVDYGLLLQQSFIEARRGSAVSHDTRLGVGAVVRVGGVPLYASLAGHYSRLQYFDIESLWIPYLEVQLGWVHAF